MKKKVCVFTTHPSKDLRVLNRQCFSLARNGWDVTLIATAAPYLNEDAIVGEYYDGDVKVIGMKLWGNKWGKFKSLSKITELAEKENADIYHFHDPHLIIPALQLMKKIKKPFIYDIHEHYDIVLPYSLPNIWPLRQVTGKVLLFFETWLGSKFKNISIVYEEHRSRFEKRGCHVVHTPNYASIEDFVPNPVSEEEWQSRMNKVLFTGSLSPSRGSLLIPEIAKRVRNIRPDVKFLVTRRFHKPAHEQAFLDILGKPGYENCVELLPNVSGTELPKIVRSAGIALSVDQPTQIGLTSQPTKTYEYMSQALAIVASELPHTVECVKELGCGVVVKPEDPQGYADAIIDLLNDPEKLTKMGTIGQEAFKKKYNWSIVEKRLVDFYELISKK